MVIKVKRGTATPTTANISNVGEMAFDTNSNALYIRGNTNVVRVGVTELVHYYEGPVSSYRFNHEFDKNYIYKIHVVASTSGSCMNDTQIEYFAQQGSQSHAYGASINVYVKDGYSTVSQIQQNNTGLFNIKDGYTNRTTARYATTKVIDFELSPTQESYVTSTYTWIAHGYSVTCASDQSDTGISQAVFSNAIDVSINSINIKPGLSTGNNKTFVISVYRMKRR